MKNYNLKQTPFPLVLLGFAVLLGISVYSFVKISNLTTRITNLSSHVAFIDSTMASTTRQLDTLMVEVDNNFKRQSASIAYVEQKVGFFRDQVGSVSSTVSAIEKLTKTDPQLLAKYSKVFFLSENYAPERIEEIPERYRYSSTKSVSIHADVLPRLQKMMDDARNDGIDIAVSSGFRSFTEQKNLKGEYKVVYGAGTANQFSADQGYSEHQLGTTIDFTTTELKGALDGFEKTRAYTWLMRNGARYGFVISYPEGNKFYQFEPWHWRYVGVKLATELRAQNKFFYDLDQRTIDTYLIHIFD